MNAERLQRGHRWFAWCYSSFIARSDPRRFRAARERIMGEVKGRVLEFGAGGGTSFPFYPPEAQVIATEPDPHMLKRAQQRVRELGVSNIDVRQAPAERLPFDDASFDHVVCSWVLCTVDDLPGTLREVRRVLKPDGTFRVMEHVRNDTNVVWRMAENAIAGPWHWAGAGCRINQRTERAIEDAGFRFEWIEHESGWLQPIIYGVARAA